MNRSGWYAFLLHMYADPTAMHSPMKIENRRAGEEIRVSIVDSNSSLKSPRCQTKVLFNA